MKKLISILLCFVMLVSATTCMPMVSSAADNTVSMQKLYSGKRVSKPKITVTSVINGKNVKLSTSTKKAKIYYKTSKNGKYKRYTKPFRLKKTTTLYVRAKRSHWKTSRTVSKKIVVTKLSRPNSKVTALSPSKIKISWNRISGADGYYIYRAYSIDGEYTCVKKITGGSTISWTNSGLNQNTCYYYRVRAFAYGKVTSDSYRKSAKTPKIWGQLEDANIEKFYVSDLTRYEGEVLGMESSGGIAYFIYFNPINNVEGYEIEEVWSSGYERTYDLSICPSNGVSNNCIMIMGQEFPSYITITPYRYYNDEFRYGPSTPVPLDGVSSSGSLYSDDFESMFYYNFGEYPDFSS
ncbi:MAG: hypothetical protein ACI4IN_03585 [Eubacterium sp.]